MVAPCATRSNVTAFGNETGVAAVRGQVARVVRAGADGTLAGTVLANAAGADANASAALCGGGSASPRDAAGCRSASSAGRTTADGPCANVAIAGSARVIGAGRSISRDRAIPKNATIVAAAATPSPISERISPPPRPIAIEPGGENDADRAAGSGCLSQERDRNVKLSIFRMLSEQKSSRLL